MPSSTKQKLRLTGALAALAMLALAVSCRGFFQNPTLTAITISPSAPQVQINRTQPMTVYGTYNDGSTAQVTSGVTWTSSSPSVASFPSPTDNLLQGVSLGTATITANAQAVTGTASATVFLGGITSMKVSPTVASISGTQGQSFTFTAVSNGQQVDITTDNGGTLTMNPTSVDLTCSPSGNQEVCTADGSQTGTQNISLTMTYPGTTISATATVTLSQ